MIKRFFYTYKRIISIAYKVNRKSLILVTILNSLWGLTNLPSLYINKILIDIVIANIGKPDMTAGIRMIVILVLARGLVEFSRATITRFNSNITQNFTEEISAYLERVEGIKLNSLDIPTVESPDFQNKFKKIQREGNNRLWGMIGSLSDIPNAFFTIISGLVPLLVFNPFVAVIVLIVTIPDIVAGAKLSRKDYQAMEFLSPRWRIWGWIFDHIAETRHFYENRILNNTNYLASRLEKVQKEILDHQQKRRSHRAIVRMWASIPSNVLLIILNIYFFVLAIVSQITLGTAQLLYQSTNTLALGFGSFFNDAVSIYENYLYVGDLTWFLELEPKIIDGKRRLEESFTKGLEFRDVWFKYPNSKSWVLKGISFSIGPTDNLALVGENGAGKTTIIKLLSGFYKPTKGEVLVNGINIFDYNQTEYRDVLGVLFQDFSWYPFTSRESIGIGDVERIGELDEIKDAARLTGIDDFILDLPLGYDNPLAKEFEKGVEPSKGQWQRIALARVLFRNSKLIVLDEPTSNVDPQAEEKIFSKIIELAKDKILILISHRFSTVKTADKILFIENGKVKEEGTHKELMELDREYAKLFRLQAKGYK